MMTVLNPTAFARQELEPGEGAEVPRGQASQRSMEALRKVPTGQGEQALALAAGALPAGQGVQSGVLGSRATVPGAQGEQMGAG